MTKTSNAGSGNKISIFLVDGEPDGLKTAQLDDWGINIIVVPKDKIASIKKRKDCEGNSIYFLIEGEDEEVDQSATTSRPRAYIGITNDLHQRLSRHSSKSGQKAFWHTAIAFVNSGNIFTQSSIQYLESQCCEIAKRAGRFDVEENKQNPSTPEDLQESDISLMKNGILPKLKLMLSVFGYPILQEARTTGPEFTCFLSKKAVATAQMTSDRRFVVHKGSKATIKPSKGVEKKYHKDIEKLKTEGYLKKEDENCYIFAKDCVFKSPSGACNVILGRHANGWTEWKTEKGETLAEIHGQGR